MPRLAVIETARLAPSAVQRVVVDGQPPFAVYHLDGEYFVTADTCTHGDASLAEGDVEGDEIVCPFHLGAFHIRTGAAARAPCVEALRAYAVTVRDGVLYIEI